MAIVCYGNVIFSVGHSILLKLGLDWSVQPLEPFQALVWQPQENDLVLQIPRLNCSNCLLPGQTIQTSLDLKLPNISLAVEKMIKVTLKEV